MRKPKTRKPARKYTPRPRARKAPAPKARRRRANRCNPESDEQTAAAELFEEFHGKPSTRTRTVKERFETPTHLADLGRLVSLTVLLDEDNAADLNFMGNVRVACTSDGGALYFVGGKQRLDLKALGRSKHLPKDRVTIGPVLSIVYFTAKGFHDFEPSEYEHDFSEGAELPTLGYDVRNEKLYLDGGSYRVTANGIED